MEALDNMRVYVGTYGKYNEGSIAGKWLTLGDYDDKEEFIAACNELHKDEPSDCRELMFQDWEGIPSGCISECSINENLWGAFDEFDYDEAQAFIAWCDYEGEEIDGDSAIRFRDGYCGKWGSEEEFAGDMLDSCYPDLPEIARDYFDLDKWTRDLFYDYFSIECDEGNGPEVWVFRC